MTPAARRMPAGLPLLVLLGLLSLPTPSRAQSVQGLLRDRETGSPVEGALVLLLDAANRSAGGGLTGPDGRFVVRSRSRGTHTLRVYRIGYETIEAQGLQLREGEVVEVELEAAMDPITLDELRVEAEQRCVVRPEEGEELARVWEEARKALTVQAWVEGEELFRFRMAEFQREMDPEGKLVLSETRTLVERVSSTPVRSRPPEELIERGFIRPTEDGSYDYFGPDASALLSDPFLDTHCFRLGLLPASPELVGLSFEPVRQGGPPDIRGTLWLERGSARLRTLEFEYEWAPWQEAAGVGQGRVEFRELPNGAWIIPRWWIRMPSMSQSQERGRRGFQLIGTREVGGEVIRVLSLDGEGVVEGGTGGVRGRVIQADTGDPAPGITVFHSAGPPTSTDATGGFLLRAVSAGGQRLLLTPPFLDSLGVSLREIETWVPAGDTIEVTVELPARAEILAAVCGRTLDESRDAVVTGTVRTETGETAPGTRVYLEWTRDGFWIFDSMAGTQVTADHRGRYRVCGFPAEEDILMRAGPWNSPGPIVEFRAHPGEILTMDLISGHGRVPEGR